MKRVQVFHYKIVQEVSIFELYTNPVFKNHERLIVFATYGTSCVHCGKVGSRLILGRASNGSLHWDVYTRDLYPITVDHIIPKSRGGGEELENKQPMCSGCNTRKGNGDNITLNAKCKWPPQNSKLKKMSYKLREYYAEVSNKINNSSRQSC